MIDTITALSTPPGRAALGLIRISGPKAIETIEHLAKQAFPIRVPTVVSLTAGDGAILDESLVTVFKAPNSYTGEDLVEISAHGNPLILGNLLRAIVSRGTVRPAEAGEFTRRALANGKLSLEKVEALDWILNSRSDEGVRLGLQAKLNGLGADISLVTEQMLDLLVMVQSALDFSIEEVGDFDKAGAFRMVSALESRLQTWNQIFEKRKHLIEGWSVALVGPPNSGKSSLFNALCGFNKAIVFDRPGTTRDSLEFTAVIDGSDVILVDTAGLRSTNDEVEALGINKSKESLRTSNVVLWVTEQNDMPSEELLAMAPNAQWIFVQSKADLMTLRVVAGESCSVNKGSGRDSRFLYVSSVTKEGLQELKEKIRPQSCSVTGVGGMILSERQSAHIKKALTFLSEARGGLESGEYLDMVTEQIQMANGELKAIVDEVPNEDVLRNIFSRFCIGK